MSRKTSHKSNPARGRSGTSTQMTKQKISVKHAAKKRHQKLTKDRSERVRDALNRDADLLYNVLEKPSTAPSCIFQTDSVVSLAESMQGLGRWQRELPAIGSAAS